ncbi:MAG: PorP/SprF family type IX secretion system membrane protein [Bacteroidales bacterium]|nr:PorP/SprF family type IX secretion system membrane protein [Bacteroidales bacterium]
MKTKYILIVSLFLSVNFYAQDIHFINQDITKTILNPSYAGKNEQSLMTGIVYRDQWSELGKIYKTYTLAGEILLPNQSRQAGNLGVGLWIDRDNAGYVRLGTNQVGLSIAYHAKLNDQNIFAGGIYGGVLNQHLSQDNMRWDSQYNGIYYDASLSSNETFSAQSITKPDVGAGISYHFSNRKQKGEGISIQTGFAMYHLNKPDLSYTSSGTDKLHTRNVFHLSSIVDISRTIISLNPSVLYMQQGKSTELSLSFKSIFDITKSQMKGGNIQKIWAGFHYRNKDAIIAEIGIQSYNVAFSFAYDWTISSLKGKGIGAFELGLKYQYQLFKMSSNRLL